MHQSSQQQRGSVRQPKKTKTQKLPCNYIMFNRQGQNRNSTYEQANQHEMQTLLTKQYSEFDPPDAESQEEKDRIVNFEIALLEEASLAAESCQANPMIIDSASSLIDQNIPPQERKKQILSNVMNLNPQLITSEASLAADRDQNDLKSKLFGSKKTATPIFKSNLFSPIMRLDLIRKGESQAISPHHHDHYDDHVHHQQSRKLSQINSETQALYSHRNPSGTSTVAGIYNLAQKTRRKSNFCLSSTQEVYRNKIQNASQSKSLFKKESFAGTHVRGKEISLEQPNSAVYASSSVNSRRFTLQPSAAHSGFDKSAPSSYIKVLKQRKHQYDRRKATIDNLK